MDELLTVIRWYHDKTGGKIMSSFVRPFNPASVTRQVEDITISLPDHVPTDPLISWPYRVPTDPLVRPGVARYAGATLVLMHIHSEAPFDFSSPVIGTVRNVNLDVTLSGGIDQLLEISPLPLALCEPCVPSSRVYRLSTSAIAAQPIYRLMMNS